MGARASVHDELCFARSACRHCSKLSFLFFNARISDHSATLSQHFHASPRQSRARRHDALPQRRQSSSTRAASDMSSRTHPGMPNPLRDAIKRPGFAYSLIVKMRGVARQKAQSVLDRDLSEIARAPSGAPCAAFVRTPGRAFRSGEKPEVSQLLAGIHSGPGRSPGAAPRPASRRLAKRPLVDQVKAV